MAAVEVSPTESKDGVVFYTNPASFSDLAACNNGAPTPTHSATPVSDARRRWSNLHSRLEFGSKLAPVVRMAMERDKRKCTSAAVCCPWYMCLREKGRATVRGITTNVYYSAAHIVLSLYIIFYDDVLRAFLPKEADPAFSVVSLFAMAAFLFDLQLQSAVDRKFVYSFFWWLDIMATLSILVDLPIVTEKLEGEDFVLLGGAAQAGTRTGRFLRLMRVVRLLRIIRLIKMWQYRRLREAKVTQLKRLTERRRKALLRSVAADDPEAAAALLNANAAELNEMASQVRRLSTVRTIDSATTAKAVRNVMNRRRTRRRQSLALSLRDLKAKMQELQGDTTTKSSKVYKSFAARRIAVKMEMKLIAGVICIMIVLPALEYTSPMDVANPMLQLKMLEASAGPAQQTVADAYLADNGNAVYLMVNKKVFHDELHKTESLRASEITRYTLTQNVTEAVFDTSAARRSEGLWGFLKTNVIIFLLAAQAFLLSRDVDNVLIRPLDSIAAFLRPVMGWAMDDVDEQAAIDLGKREGPEIMTRMMLVTLERLLASLKDSDRRELAKKRAKHKLRLQMTTYSNRLADEFEDLAFVLGIRGTSFKRVASRSQQRIAKARSANAQRAPPMRFHPQHSTSSHLELGSVHTLYDLPMIGEGGEHTARTKDTDTSTVNPCAVNSGAEIGGSVPPVQASPVKQPQHDLSLHKPKASPGRGNRVVPTTDDTSSGT